MPGRSGCSRERSSWVWMLMKPGHTARPAASSARPLSLSRRSPTASMRPPLMPTSARRPFPPLPS